MKENRYIINLVKVGFGTHDYLLYIIGGKNA